MDPGTDGKPRHFRGKPRPGRRVPVQYRVQGPPEERGESGGSGGGGGGGGMMVSAVTRNLGAGGAFLLCSEPHPVGTRLHLTMRLPTTEQDIEVAAEVRWVIPPGEDGVEAGMGVKFLDPGVDTVLALSKYFASLTGADLLDMDSTT